MSAEEELECGAAVGKGYDALEAEAVGGGCISVRRHLQENLAGIYAASVVLFRLLAQGRPFIAAQAAPSGMHCIPEALAQFLDRLSAQLAVAVGCRSFVAISLSKFALQCMQLAETLRSATFTFAVMSSRVVLFICFVDSHGNRACFELAVRPLKLGWFACASRITVLIWAILIDCF